MKSSFKWILTALLLIGVIAGAAVLYDRFSEEYKSDNLLANQGTQNSEEENSSQEENQREDQKEGLKEDQEEDQKENQKEDGKEDPKENQGEGRKEDPDNDREGGKSSENSESGQSPSYAAPDFTVLDYEGNEVKLSDYIGKPIVLNFWATWCYYCKMEMPDFNEAYGKYPDIQFFMVNATDGVQETVDTAKDYVEKEGYEFDIFFDTNQEAVLNYAVTGFPCTYFIDAEGNLTARAAGMIDMETLEKGIQMITE